MHFHSQVLSHSNVEFVSSVGLLLVFINSAARFCFRLCHISAANSICFEIFALLLQSLICRVISDRKFFNSFLYYKRIACNRFVRG